MTTRFFLRARFQSGPTRSIGMRTEERTNLAKSHRRFLACATATTSLRGVRCTRLISYGKFITSRFVDRGRKGEMRNRQRQEVCLQAGNAGGGETEHERRRECHIMQEEMTRARVLEQVCFRMKKIMSIKYRRKSYPTLFSSRSSFLERLSKFHVFPSKHIFNN